MKLVGKVAIVTGSSRGIGKAIAIAFAAEGARVVIAARSETENEQIPGTIHRTAEEIQSLGRKAFPIKCDVTDEQSVNDMVRRTLEQFGRIDILVNNAGTGYWFPIMETPMKRWELVIRVNLTGAFICTKAVLPKMIEQKSGSIINISSLAANERDGGVVPTGIAYAVSKAGLDRFTWGLAAEVGKYNIAVNAIKPHKVILTEGIRRWLSEFDESQCETTEPMARCAVLLATQDARGITGMVATDEEFLTWHGLK